jgi:hypothetical protein
MVPNEKIDLNQEYIRAKTAMIAISLNIWWVIVAMLQREESLPGIKVIWFAPC